MGVCEFCGKESRDLSMHSGPYTWVNYCPDCMRALNLRDTQYFSKIGFAKATKFAKEDVTASFGLETSPENTDTWQNNEIDLQNDNVNDWDYQSRFSLASGRALPYVVLQVTLKEKLIGTGSRNLTDLEAVINAQVAKGYRLHTMSTSNGGSKGLGGGDRIQATLVFERLDLR